MAQQIQTYAITAPGFYGLNTQDSSLDLASGFALTATNCVIDKYGRIGSRKGWQPRNDASEALGTADVKAIGELVIDDGTEYIVCAGNNKLFKLVGSTLTELTYGGPSTAPTITDSNWSITTLNGAAYFFQLGHEPLVFDPFVSTTTYMRISEVTGYTGTVPQADIAISAFGRLWVAKTTSDKVTIKWSDLMLGHVWSTGTSGSLDVTTVWPRGGDSITGLAAHNGFLFIFGRNTILIYSGATDPSTTGDFKLHDTIIGTGCIARDSVHNTGNDIVFLSDIGVQSVQRLIQEKSAPLRDISKNVRDDLMQAVAGESATNIKAVYSPFESFYLLSLPGSKVVYCFDMKQQLPDGSARVTTWTGLSPKSFCYMRDESLLIGQPGFVGEYGGHTDNGTSYLMQYYTNHTDLGAPSVTTVLKKLSVVVIGGSSQSLVIKWGYDFGSDYQSQPCIIAAQDVDYFNVGEYNIAEYAGGIALTSLTAYPTGSGKVIQTGYEAEISGTPLSIQKIEIHAKNGKVV